MKKQIFCIDWNQCRKYNNIVFNVYECSYKVNKKGLFSGPLRNADLFENNSLMNNYNYTKINRNTFFLNEDILHFFKDVITSELLFIRLMDKSLKKIRFLENNVQVNTNDGTGLNIEVQNNRVKLNKSTIFFSFNNFTFFINGGGLYVLNRVTDSKYLNECISKGKNIESYDFIDLNETDFDNISVKILKSLYIEFKNNQVMGRIFIDCTKDVENVCESEYVKELNLSNWILQSSKYIYIGNDLSRDVNDLLNKGWRVYNKGKAIKAISKNSFKYSYGTDWLELNIDYVVDNKIISLIELLEHVSRNSGDFVELKSGDIVVLPQNIKDNLEVLSNLKTTNEIRANTYMIPRLSKIFKDENLGLQTNHIEYKNITLNLDTKIYDKLFNYQKEGVRWLKYLKVNNFNGCLADDMGLGKTIQVIAFLSDLDIAKTHTKTLVIVPKTLLFNWELEISNLNDKIQYRVYHGNQRDKDFIDVDVVITTYDIVINEIDFFESIYFDNCIIDESQLAKNHLTYRYKSLKRINAKTKIALSGTPFENNLDEMYYLMDLLNPNLLGSYKDFKRKYIDTSNNEELREIVGYFILRRTKYEVLHELPKKVEKIIRCNMTEGQRIIYDIVKETARKDIEEGNYNLNFGKVLQVLNNLRQICCHPKLVKNSVNILNTCNSGKFEYLKGLLESSVNNKNKILVFSQYTSMLKIMEEWIKLKGYKYSYLDGKCSNRREIIEEYTKREDNFIFLLSIKAAGVGINLISANTVVIYDPWWNPAVENQAIDRCYRIGQNQDVTVYKLIAKNSIEEKILELNLKKSELFKDILSNQNIIKSLKVDEIIKLFEE